MFVWGVWAGLFAAALGFVSRYGPAFPRWDDFATVPVLTGTGRLTLGWLWSQHNEHRVPLPKLVLLGLLRLSGGDFRAGMVFNVAVLGLLALGLALAARRRRGAWRATDAVFPLALLHLGHQANLLWAWQAQFVLSTALAGGLLLLVASGPGWPGPRKAVAAGVLLALLPLCGANGVALVPAPALWLLTASAAQTRRHGWRAGLGNLLAATFGLFLLILYFHNYHAAGHQAARPGLAVALTTALQFVSLTFGPSASVVWPYSGAVVAALLVLSAGLLARVAFTRPEERPRALGLLAVLGGLGSLALGLGWGRAGAGAAAGFEPRYVTLAAPFACTFYDVWDLYGGPPALRRLVPLVLFGTALATLWPNTESGLTHGGNLADEAARFERDVRSGAPTFLVIKRATPFLHPSEDELTAALPALRGAGVGVFRFLRPDPEFREVPLPTTPTGLRMARWDGGTAHVTGVDPMLTYALPVERYVAGVRLRYAHANRDGTPARFRAGWRRAGQAEAPPDQRAANWNLPTGPGRSTTVWVGDMIGAFEVQPDNRPCEFRVDSITLLVPAG